MVARALNIAVGIWLIISIFVWPHTGTEKLLTGVWVGYGMVMIGFMALVEPRARFGEAVLAVFLVVLAIFLPHASAITFWHNLAMAVLAFGAAMVPSQRLLSAAGRRRRHTRRVST